MTRFFAAIPLGACTLLAACAADAADAPRADIQAGPPDTETPDVERPDMAPADAEPPDNVEPVATGRRFVLGDGRVIEGEVIAVYDHARWWVEPSAMRTFAVFDPSRFSPWPDDRSVLFVDEDDVVSEEAVTLPDDRPSYRAWLAAREIGIQRVPTEQPSMIITAHEDHHLAENGYGDFAWDLVLTDAAGARVTGDGADLEDYLSWDAAVVAPVDGLVVEVERDAPDVAPGSLPAEGLEAVENLVGIRIAGGFFAYVLHLRQTTVPSNIEVGTIVEAGAPLGRVGNSGTTLEPHLHLVMLYWDFERGRFWSVPAEMFELWVAPSPTGATWRDRADPARGHWIGDRAF